MKKFPFSLQLVVFTLITAFIWIGSDIYRTFSIKTSPTVPQEMLTPVNPEIDVQTLDELKERVYLIDEQIEDTLILEEGQEEELIDIDEITEEEIEDITEESTDEATIEESTESAEAQ